MLYPNMAPSDWKYCISVTKVGTGFFSTCGSVIFVEAFSGLRLIKSNKKERVKLGRLAAGSAIGRRAYLIFTQQFPKVRRLDASVSGAVNYFAPVFF